jgi:hypothetical protein
MGTRQKPTFAGWVISISVVLVGIGLYLWLRSRLANGCHLDRNMKALVAAQSFCSVEVQEFYLERTPRTHGYLYRGGATK